MNKAVTDVITSYKPLSTQSLKDQQMALTPYVDSNMVDTQVFEYIYDNQRTLVNPDREACYRLRYIYLNNIDPRKYIHYSTSKYYLDYLVAENIVDPFLLFINGKMVPWHMIRVIMSHETYHLLCEAPSKNWLKEFNEPKSIQIIHLPSSCVYTDINVKEANNRVFGFDLYGRYTLDPNCEYSILNESPDMRFVKESVSTGVNATIIDSDTRVKYFPENVILFRNGVLDTNFTASFDSTLLTIDNGQNPNGDQLDYIVFKDIRIGEKVDNIKYASLDYIQPHIQNKYEGTPLPEYLQDFEKEFNLEMDKNLSYDENVKNSIDYITKYNSSLFEDAYLQDKNLTIEEKTGQWVIDNTGYDGYLTIPRKHGEFTDEHILMLVNGVLYKFYYMAKYYNNKWMIPISGINPDDVVEFMRFDDINNNTFDIIVRENDGFAEYDKNYINSDMVLFSTIPPTKDFEFPEDGLQHFPVAYTIEYDETGEKFRIRFEDNRYYGKKLKLVYKHQFRHYWFDITQSMATDSYCVDLRTKFMYCHDYSKYLVFFNGRRLSTDQYRLCLPVRSTTPFYRFELYLTMFVSDGDRVDVIYTPSLLKDVVLIPQIEEDGKIVVDKSDITYSSRKDLYMVWANGKKIPASKISNIDSTHIRINEDIETLRYVCLTKFLPDIDELTDVFQNNRDVWDKIMASLTDQQIADILNQDIVTISDTETDMYEGSINIRSVMLELIREKYVMNAGVDTTQPFVYDYLDVDDTAVGNYDKEGNALLDSADANVTENIDGIERPWP